MKKARVLVFLCLFVNIAMGQTQTNQYRKRKYSSGNKLSINAVNGNGNIIAGGNVINNDANYGKIKSRKKSGEYDDPLLRVGRSYIVVSGGKGDLEKIFRPVCQGIDFKWWIAKHQLFVDATIRDPQGNIIVQIHNNEWQVGSNCYAFDKNYNTNALEVLNSQGDVVFQIQLIKNALEFAGVFYKSDGSAFALVPGKYLNESGAELYFLKPGEQLPIKLKRIFKYPSKLHPGERSGNNIY